MVQTNYKKRKSPLRGRPSWARFFCGVVAIGGALSLSPSLHADTINWTLAGSGSWDVAANWTDTTNSTHVVPTAADTVTVSNGSTVSKNSGSLDASSLTLSGSTLSISSTPTYNIASTILKTGGNLIFGSNYTLNNNTVTFGDTNSGTSLVTAGNGTLTLGAGELVHGNTGRIYGNGAIGNLANAGTISADVSGGTISLGNGGGSAINLTNTGTLSALNGGTLSYGGATFTNTGTLTANGTGSTINLSGTTTFLNGSVLNVLNGGVINIIGSSNNAGSLVIAGTYGGGFNTGTVSVPGNGTLTGGYTQTAGATIVDGTLVGNQILTINNGTLTGKGTIVGNVVNNGGSISPNGPSSGKLTINGNYSQAIAGSLTVDLAGYTQGTTYDWLSVSGTSTLNGILNVNLLNGFSPIVGDTFTFLNYSSKTGAFSTLNSLNNGYGYSVTYNGTNAQLHVTQSAAANTPEPGTVGLLIGLGGFGLALTRRRNTRKKA